MFVSGQNVNCSSKYTIHFKGIFTEKNVSSFSKCKSCSLFFFNKHISLCVIFNNQSLNDTLTNDIVGFVQLGPGLLSDYSDPKYLWLICKLI